MSQPTIYVPSRIICPREDGTREVYITNEKLGRGGFAVVHRVTEQSTNKSYAMKVISKERYSNNKSFLEKIQNEIQIQKKLNHQNVVSSKISFTDNENQYILLEYCPGQSIREYLRKSQNGRLSESETRKILKDVIQGLVYLHSQRIIHHDLKLENFLVGADGRVKIADFGISTLLKTSSEKVFSFAGTLNYMSPETVSKENKGHSFEVDIWAIGVCAFVMMTGQQPFGFNKVSVFERIKKCDYRFPINIPLSYEAVDFIRSILRIDPKKRPTAIELLRHPFMKKIDNEDVQLYKPIISIPSKPTQIKSIPSLINNNNLFNIGCYNNHCSPLFLRNSSNNAQIVKPKISDDSLKKFDINFGQENYQMNRLNAYPKKTFVIPNHYVVKYCFYNDDMAFLLGDGTVGVCFSDHSRIVMDPNEEFVQYYKNFNSNKEVIVLDDFLDDNQNSELKSKISIVRKLAKNFKKFKYLYNIEKEFYDSGIPLFYVNNFVKKNDAILFKMNDKSIQVNFYDHKKLIIFWNTKKMVLVKNLNEKCNLIDLKNIVTMNPSCEEYKKYNVAKEMLLGISM